MSSAACRLRVLSHSVPLFTARITSLAFLFPEPRAGPERGSNKFVVHVVSLLPTFHSQPPFPHKNPVFAVCV